MVSCGNDDQGPVVSLAPTFLTEKSLAVVEYNFTSQINPLSLSTSYLVLYAIRTNFRSLFIDPPPVRSVRSEKIYDEFKKVVREPGNAGRETIND